MEIIYSIADYLISGTTTLINIVTSEAPSGLCSALGVSQGTSWIQLLWSPVLIGIVLIALVVRWLWGSLT